MTILLKKGIKGFNAASEFENENLMKPLDKAHY